MSLLRALLHFNIEYVVAPFRMGFLAETALIVSAGYGIYQGRKARKRAEAAAERREREAQAALQQAERRRQSDRMNAEKVAARNAKLSKSRKQRRDQRQSNAAALYQSGGFPGRPPGAFGNALGTGSSILGV